MRRSRSLTRPASILLRVIRRKAEGRSISCWLEQLHSGLKWVRANAIALKIDAKRTIVASESGGGNLVLAVGTKLKQGGEGGLSQGIYSLCPYIAGKWPPPQYPSSIENEGGVLNFGDNRATRCTIRDGSQSSRHQWAFTMLVAWRILAAMNASCSSATPHTSTSI